MGAGLKHRAAQMAVSPGLQVGGVQPACVLRSARHSPCWTEPCLRRPSTHGLCTGHGLDKWICTVCHCCSRLGEAAVEVKLVVPYVVLRCVPQTAMRGLACAQPSRGHVQASWHCCSSQFRCGHPWLVCMLAGWLHTKQRVFHLLHILQRAGPAQGAAGAGPGAARPPRHQAPGGAALPARHLAAPAVGGGAPQGEHWECVGLVFARM